MTMPHASTADTALLDAVIAWRDRPAQPDLRGLPVINVPVLGRVRKALPASATARALAAAYTAGVRLSQPQSLRRQAGVGSLEALRTAPLSVCDALARKTATQAGWIAGGSGAALGIAGIAGLVADAPALLLIALRTLVRLGYCYGEQPSPALVAALFALASADTDNEKRLAWQDALTAPAGGADELSSPNKSSRSEAAVRDGLERAAEREFAKQALTGSLQKLAATLVQRLGVKKATGLLPLLGAVVGGAVNIRFVYLLAESARMAFTARRLLADGLPMRTLVGDEPLIAIATPRHSKKRSAPLTAQAKQAARTAKVKTTPRRQRPTPVL